MTVATKRSIAGCLWSLKVRGKVPVKSDVTYLNVGNMSVYVVYKLYEGLNSPKLVTK